MDNSVVSVVHDNSETVGHFDGVQASTNLSRFLNAPIVEKLELVTSPYALRFEGEGLRLYHLLEKNFHPIAIDFDQVRKPISNDPLLRAMGKKSQVVIDATAGWCEDALNLVRGGFKVRAVERNPIVMAMLMHAQDVASSTAVKHYLELIFQDSVCYLNSLQSRVCVVYLDPMYPRKNKAPKSKKELQVLQGLVGEPTQEQALLAAALRCATQRVVVKRPHHAPPLSLGDEILDSQRSGGFKVGDIQTKLVRFDIYKPFEQ